MPKEHVKRSLERDAFLCRNEDKEASLQRLKTSVERLSKAMSLSQADKAELLNYTEKLLEQRTQTRVQSGQDNARARTNSKRGVLGENSPFSQNSVLNEKAPSGTAEGAGASD